MPKLIFSVGAWLVLGATVGCDRSTSAPRFDYGKNLDQLWAGFLESEAARGR